MKILIGNHIDPAIRDRGDLRAWTQRVLWFARDGDAVVLSCDPDRDFLAYATALTGTDPRSLAFFKVPQGGPTLIAVLLGRHLTHPGRHTPAYRSVPDCSLSSPGQYAYTYYVCPWKPTNPRDVRRCPGHVRASVREDHITTAISSFLDRYFLGHDAPPCSRTTSRKPPPSKPPTARPAPPNSPSGSPATKRRRRA